MNNAARALATPVWLDIQPVAGRTDAEIRGVTLSGGLGAATVEVIQAALVRHKMIFFRDQSHLDDQTQETFAHLLGKPVAHLTMPSREDTHFLLKLDGAEGHRANSWHTDVAFIEAYPKALILHSMVALESGDDTVWANTASAYADLLAGLRKLADRFWTVHGNECDYAGIEPNASLEQLEDYRKALASTVYETGHPVVRVHPQSGERTLLLGHLVERPKGFSQHDSAHLFAVLQGHITHLENTVHWRWQAGSATIWDNRAAQHYVVDDYDDQPRVMHRMTLGGDMPIGIDEQRSRTIRKA